MRPLTSTERERLKYLTRKSVPYTLIQPTATGLKKAILDATAPVREFLVERGAHNYADQGKGSGNKVYMEAKFLGPNSQISSVASLYRPVTKKGDPRIWFSRLTKFALPDDILAIIENEGRLFVLNVSRDDFPERAEASQGPIFDLISQISTAANSISEELLDKLRAIAERGPLKSVMANKADTAIGRTIENALGIPMNSRREPDYKGIELKSRRHSARSNRHTLFAKVPDWRLSQLKSSAAILDTFGYEVSSVRKLNCTVRLDKPNPQGLFLHLEKDPRFLEERSNLYGLPSVAKWAIEDLRDALKLKHAETFWITAKSTQIEGREWFQLQSVRHTREPILPQFDVLLALGEISVDHLIKRNSKGRVSERGPLFKVTPRSLGMLFPPSVDYDLTR